MARPGITAHPDGAWTTQATRNFLMDIGHRAATINFLIRDRASQFTSSYDAVFSAEGIRRIVASLPQAPEATTRSSRHWPGRVHGELTRLGYHLSEATARRILSTRRIRRRCAGPTGRGI